MAPFYKFDFFGEQTSFIIAVVIGISFGFWLERAGFAESRKLALQFYFREMTVLKVMFTAIVVAMLGLAYLTLFGGLDISEVYINPTYMCAQAVGGLMLGAGMVIVGFCPGTSVVGAAIGRIDAYVYLAGVLFGMLVFGEIFPWIEGLYLSGDMGRVTLMDYFSTSTGIMVFLVMIMAVGMFFGGEWLEKKFRTEGVQ
jgi:hypothetical protein